MRRIMMSCIRLLGCMFLAVCSVMSTAYGTNPSSACGTGVSPATIEDVDSSRAWASPCWGYNAPKIVRNARGELWAINFFGKYGDEKAQVLKRRDDGSWIRGMIFEGIYQPGMLFLDRDGRLNVVQNSQHEPIRHYRSTDDENLNNFELVARGNGIPDGRGWYVGVGVHDTTVYMAYVTLTYDLFLTWKGVRDTSWHEAVLIEQGEVDTVRGNHSWLYPRFNFFGSKGYITVSSTVDGSKKNTYDKIFVATFSLSDPSQFTTELIFDGTVGYYSYCFDTIICDDGTIVCGFNAGRHSYGPKRKSAVPEGVYVAVQRPKAKRWQIRRIDDTSGGVALQSASDGVLYAAVIRGSWDTDNVALVKRSSDYGKTWSNFRKNAFASRPDLKHPFFLQTVHSHSGSTVGRDLHGLMTSHASTAPVDGTYGFTLLHVVISTE